MRFSVLKKVRRNAPSPQRANKFPREWSKESRATNSQYGHVFVSASDLTTTIVASGSLRTLSSTSYCGVSAAGWMSSLALFAACFVVAIDVAVTLELFVLSLESLLVLVHSCSHFAEGVAPPYRHQLVCTSFSAPMVCALPCRKLC